MDAVDRPDMLWRPHPHPVFRHLHRAVFAAIRGQAHEVVPAGRRLPPLPQPREDLLLPVPEDRVGGQDDPDRPAQARVGQRRRQAVSPPHRNAAWSMIRTCMSFAGYPAVEVTGVHHPEQEPTMTTAVPPLTEPDPSA